MRKIFILFICLILASGELYAWEKELEIVKSQDGSVCRVYKDWILKFDLKKTIEEPEGDQGSQIAIIKRAGGSPEDSCKSSKISSTIELGGKSFVGYSQGFLYLQKYKSAPGTCWVQIIDVAAGREKTKLFTSGRPIEVQGTKITFWEPQRDMKGFDCKGHETTPSFGCVLNERVEVDLRSGKKRLLGEKEIIPIQ